MNDPNLPPPEPGTRGQTPEDVERMTPRPRFAEGDPVPNRELWHLERKLGEGGFGEVWLAKHDWKDERVAVKFCTHPAARHQLVTHEKKVVARVMRHAGDHPNVVPLLDCNLSGDTPWLIYQYVPGGTLAQQVLDGWAALPLPRRLGRTVRVMHALAAALARFHRLNPPLVHRDMKPHNVLMDGSTPRITDFGLGSAVMKAEAGDATGPYSGSSVLLPSMLRAMGTKGYAPEEQLLGSPPDPRDDVYALGVMAYRLARADLRAFPGADATDELRDMRVPSALVGLIVKSVSMNPERRPPDAGAWESELARLLPKPAAAAPAAPTSAELHILAEGDRERGDDYYFGRGVARNYAQARHWYERAAAQGNAGAQAGLGRLYLRGGGVPEDHAQARAWFEKAAAQGLAGAQLELGRMCERGEGGPRDHARARGWYERAAAQGNSAAQHNLGVFCQNGWGGPRDYAQARGWYERAAAQGEAVAQRNLGRLWEDGLGGPADRLRARDLYRAAAAAGDEPAQAALARLEEGAARQGAAPADAAGAPERPLPTAPADPPGNKRRATADELREVFGRADGPTGSASDLPPNDPDGKRAATADELREVFGHADGWKGDIFDTDFELPSPDAPDSGTEYDRLDDGGAPTPRSGAPAYDQAQCYHHGWGVPQDYNKAREWYEAAAAYGHAGAQFNLGYFHEKGHGVRKDRSRALDWYRKAAAAGDKAAQAAFDRLSGRK